MMKEDGMPRVRDGEGAPTRHGNRLRMSARDAGVILVLLGATVVLPGCLDGKSPNVASTTDYPIHEASTITETYNEASSSTTEQGVTPDDPDQAAADSTTAATSTTVDTATLVQQVINGDWGNGQDRIDALTAAGYNAGDVQSQVNDELERTIVSVSAGTPVTATTTTREHASSWKTIDQVANEVIAGDWGDGQDRIDALEAAGYDAGNVQSRVNDKLGTDANTGNEGTSVQTETNQTDTTPTNNQAGVTWHDEITEPIYEDQPVFQYCYIYTFTAVASASVSPQVTSASGYIYATAAEAETAANGSAAQTAALNTIRAAGYDAGNLSVCTYTVSTSSKQTGTKRVQTGTRIVQKAGWY